MTLKMEQVTELFLACVLNFNMPCKDVSLIYYNVYVCLTYSWPFAFDMFTEL